MKIEDAINQLLKMPHGKYEGKQQSKYAIAKALGVTPIMIDNWLSGKYKGVSDKVVVAFKREYNIDLTLYQSIMAVVDGKLKSSLI